MTLGNVPRYVSEEVFGSAIRRLHVEPSVDYDSHHFDKINFSHPNDHAKALRMKLHDSSSTSAENDLEIVVLALPIGNSASNIPDSFPHVTIVQESDCDVQQWHINQMPSMEKKTCFAI